MIVFVYYITWGENLYLVRQLMLSPKATFLISNENVVKSQLNLNGNYIVDRVAITILSIKLHSGINFQKLLLV